MDGVWRWNGSWTGHWHLPGVRGSLYPGHLARTATFQAGPKAVASGFLFSKSDVLPINQVWKTFNRTPLVLLDTPPWHKEAPFGHGHLKWLQGSRLLVFSGLYCPARDACSLHSFCSARYGTTSPSGLLGGWGGGSGEGTGPAALEGYLRKDLKSSLCQECSIFAPVHVGRLFLS